MLDDIIALLLMFEDRVPDRESHRWVLDLARDKRKWKDGHDVFDRIRRRNLMAINRKDGASQAQYCFEEVCLKCLYNETGASDPFDSDAPHWIIKNAIHLARRVGLSDADVVRIVAPQ
jgi:hypothetical protein